MHNEALKARRRLTFYPAFVFKDEDESAKEDLRDEEHYEEPWVLKWGVFEGFRSI